jgi:MFS family permease
MHHEHYNKNKVRLIGFLSFILGFLDAFLIYILSAYFSLATGSDNVGVFYFVAYSGLLLSLFYLQPLIRHIGKARALYLMLCVAILAGAFLTRLPITWLGVFIVLVFMTAKQLIWVVLDIMLESFSKDQISGRIRGFYLTVMNAGLLLAPFLSTMTLTRFHYEGVFFVLILGYMAVFLIALIGFRNDNAVFQGKIKLRQTFARMARQKNLFHIYHISFAMDFFYAMMIVYTPLYLRSLDFSWNEIGIIFTIMLIPFVFLQYPIGVLADKRLGEKELLIASIAITAITTFVLGFLGKQTLFVWAAALFLTRIGIAGIELLRDSHFYKQIDGDHLDTIAFFRTATPVANILGALFSAILLLFFSLKSIFFLTTLILLFSLFSAFALKDTRSEREITNY